MLAAQKIEQVLEEAAEDGGRWLTTHEVAFWAGLRDDYTRTILRVLAYAGRVEPLKGDHERGRYAKQMWRRIV